MKLIPVGFYLVLTLLFSLPAPAYSQDEVALPPSEKQGDLANSPLLTESGIHAEIEALQSRIKAFQDAENEKTATSLGVSLAQLKERTEKAQETLVFYNRQLLALKKTEAFVAEKKYLQEAVSAGKAFELSHLPPYSLKIYDNAIASLGESLSSRETSQLFLALAEKILHNFKQRFREGETQLREIKEKGGESSGLNGKIFSAQVEVALARSGWRYAQLAYRNAVLRLEISGIKASVAEQRVSHIRANLHFDAEDLEKQLLHIEEKKLDLLTASDDLLNQLQKTESHLLKAQRKLEKITDEDDKLQFKAEVDALEAWRQVGQRGLEQYEGAQQLLAYQQEVWKRRYDLIRGDAGSDDLKMWEKEAVAQKERIQQALILEQSQQGSLYLQISQVEKQLAQEDLSWHMKGNLKDRLAALKKMTESTIVYLTTLNVSSQISSRFMDEISDELAENLLEEKIADLVAKVKASWKLEVVVVDDRSVTVGKIVIALFLLVFGIILAGYFTRAVQLHMLRRTRLSESAAAITEKLLYYLTLCVVVLLSMRVVNIPLTTFAFLGGALAIGVGFGGQKIISNFISGFILMVEQPVKVGDLIQMADLVGKIEEIGARSTRVRTFANIHVLVPNSYFLENNIINWTHSDKIIRGEVTVGVVYGAPTREVRRLLLLAVSDHGETLIQPKPYVFFNDFGDNSLVFTVYFWITVQLINDKKRIESDIRFIIDDLFREAGIVIAFPQRDVHLDTSSPLKFEMVTAPEERGASEQAGPED